MRDHAACGLKVAESCQRKYGLLLGSGTTALYLAFSMLPPGRRKVIVPAIACTHVLFAVLYADCTPVFADISKDSGLIDEEEVRVAFARDPTIGAVLVVHTYGHVADLQGIARHATACGALVIEDAAQAHGGVYASGRPLGALGDLSLISFGHTKILDVGGGGVLMTDCRHMYEACVKLAAELPLPPIDLEARFENYRASYYLLWGARATDSSALRRIGQLHLQFRDTFLHQATSETAIRIIAALPSLPAQVEARVETAAIYTSLLAGLPPVRLCKTEAGAVPWRFVFRVPASHRDALVSSLRSARVDVSCWYPSLAQFWDSHEPRSILPNAEAFEREVLNLWVVPVSQQHIINDVSARIGDYFLTNQADANTA